MCEEGDQIIVSAPGNPFVSAIAKAHGVIVKEFQLHLKKDTETNELAWDYDYDVLAKLANDHVKFIYLLNPNWQIGKLLNSKRIRSLVKVCEDKNLPIVVDETYSEYIFPGQKIEKFGDFNQSCPVISINSSSRLFGMGGSKISWIVLYGDKECFEDLEKGLMINSAILGKPDILNMTSLEMCYLSNENVGYTKEKMKFVEIRNRHFQNVWPKDIGMSLGIANATFNNVIHVDWKFYENIILNTTQMCKKLVEEQGLV